MTDDMGHRMVPELPRLGRLPVLHGAAMVAGLQATRLVSTKY